MMLEKDFKSIILDIKNQINSTQIEIFQNANKSLLKLYYDLGKIIEENSSWGNKFIDELAIELKISFPNIKGFSVRNLKNMKKYYIECQKSKIVQTASAQIPWSHNMLILDKIKDEEKRVWYMNQTIKNGWSYDVLAFQIKSDLYQRQVLGDKLNNFEKTLINPQSDLAKNIMKDPYILNLTTLKENYIETELEFAMVDKIKTVLLELGNGFSFIGNQYKITVGNEDYFIDMLFYHTKLHCYIVIELKNTKFRPEYAGKVNFYLSAVDDLVKDEKELTRAIKEAISLDSKIIVEESVPNVKEANISVMGNTEKCTTSEIEEISINSEFYSFKEKYVEGYNKLNKPEEINKPIVSKEMMEDMRNYAIKAFKVIGASGVARIDFLIDDKNKKVFVNEINTIPGDLASYLWMAKKMTQGELIENLIKITISNQKKKDSKLQAFEGNLLEQYDILKGKKLQKKKDKENQK